VSLKARIGWTWIIYFNFQLFKRSEKNVNEIKGIPFESKQLNLSASAALLCDDEGSLFQQHWQRRRWRSSLSRFWNENCYNNRVEWLTIRKWIIFRRKYFEVGKRRKILWEKQGKEFWKLFKTIFKFFTVRYFFNFFKKNILIFNLICLIFNFFCAKKYFLTLTLKVRKIFPSKLKWNLFFPH
jgi:hypothetical protein